MTESFDTAWRSVEKSAFGRGRERKRQEAYARAPEMLRRFKAMHDQQQGVKPRRRPTRREANRRTSTPPADQETSTTIQDPVAAVLARNAAQQSTSPETTTLAPRLPTLIPAAEAPPIRISAKDHAEREANQDPADLPQGLHNQPHFDIAYKNGEIKQIPADDFKWENTTDIHEIDTIFESDENGEMKLVFDAQALINQSPTDLDVLDQEAAERIPNPASEVIDPTEEVVEAVNQMKPLQSDMRGLPQKPNKNFANVFKPLMTEGIAEAIGPAENRDKVISAMQRKKAKPTASKQPTPPSDAEDKKATEDRLSQAMSSEMKPVEGKPDPVAEAASKRLKPKSKGKGGMTMADLAEKPKKKTIVPSKKVEEAIKPTTEKVPRLGSRPDREDVLRVIDLVSLGNKEAYTELYGALGDLEDMGSDLYEDASRMIDEYKAMEKHRRKDRRDKKSTERKEAKGKNLSDPLTNAKDEKKMTSDDLAARLLNREKKD